MLTANLGTVDVYIASVYIQSNHHVIHSVELFARFSTFSTAREMSVSGISLYFLGHNFSNWFNGIKMFSTSRTGNSLDGQNPANTSGWSTCTGTIFLAKSRTTITAVCAYHTASNTTESSTRRFFYRCDSEYFYRMQRSRYFPR